MQGSQICIKNLNILLLDLSESLMLYALAWGLLLTQPVSPLSLDLDVALSVMSSIMLLWFLEQDYLEQKLQFLSIMVR